MTRLQFPAPRSAHSHVPRRRAALTSLLCAWLCLSCGASSTDTGNPPLVDKQLIQVVAAKSGVTVSGEAGSVEGGATVEVENTRTGSKGTTTAASDGSFAVTLEGEPDDEYQLAFELDGRTTTARVAGDKSAPDLKSQLVDHEFLLDESEGFTPVGDTTVRLSFRDTEFGFSAGCNSHGGTYEVCEDNKLCTSGLGSTEIGCNEELHSQDEWLAEFFTSKPTLELEGDSLTVSTSDAILVFLDRVVADPDRDLVGRTWTIDTFISGDAASNFALMVEPTIQFRADGTFSAFTTCVDLEGAYDVANSTLELSDVSYAEDSCDPQGSDTAHEHIVEVLADGTVDYAIEAARLTITRGDVGIAAITE